MLGVDSYRYVSVRALFAAGQVTFCTSYAPPPLQQTPIQRHITFPSIRHKPHANHTLRHAISAITVQVVAVERAVVSQVPNG